MVMVKGTLFESYRSIDKYSSTTSLPIGTLFRMRHMSLHHAELSRVAWDPLSISIMFESSMATAVYTYRPILLWVHNKLKYIFTYILIEKRSLRQKRRLYNTMPVPKHPAVLQGSTLWKLSHRRVVHRRFLSSPTTVVLFILPLVLVWWDEYCRRRRPCPFRPFSSPDCRSVPCSRRGELVGHCVLVPLHSTWSP